MVLHKITAYRTPAVPPQITQERQDMMGSLSLSGEPGTKLISDVLHMNTPLLVNQ